MLKLFENDPIFKKSVKPRPVEEIANIQIFRPLAHILLLEIKDKNISPEVIVFIHTSMVILSSILIYYKDSIFLGLLAAILLQLKTVLDNLDGQLARYKNKTTIAGRYLDTLMDYLGNLSIFIALGLKYNQLIFSLSSFLIFTFVLSYDFNIEKIHKEKLQNGKKSNLSNCSYSKKTNNLETILKKIYDYLLGYQDKLITYFENKTYVFLLNLGFSKSKAEYILASENHKNLKYFENLFWKKEYLNITANMGLSTQLLILGILLIFNMEFYFLYFPFICFAIISLLFFYRVISFLNHLFGKDKL